MPPQRQWPHKGLRFMQLHLTVKSKTRPCLALAQGAEGDTTIVSEDNFMFYPILFLAHLT